MSDLGGYSAHELRVHVHNERQKLSAERLVLVKDITGKQQRIDEIDYRLAKLDEADDALSGEL